MTFPIINLIFNTNQYQYRTSPIPALMLSFKIYCSKVHCTLKDINILKYIKTESD